MSSLAERAAVAALRSQLGPKANVWRYDRTNRTPMNFILDEVQKQLGTSFTVYWLDGGAPEVFCLPGLTLKPVVFSTRYLELSAFVRHVIVEPFDGPLRTDVASRTALKLIAELSLRYGDPEFAVLAFLKSVCGKGIFLSDGDRLLELEHQPINEAYMATWFYGLVHELGHFAPQPTDQFSGHGPFSDQGILFAIETALDKYPYSASLKRSALDKAQTQRADFVLGIDHVRAEGLADIFATSLMFRTTYDIMQEVGREAFQIERLVQEMIIFHNIVGLIDRCRQVAKIAAQRTPDREKALDMALHPVALHVRALITRVYLDHASAVFLFNTSDLSREQEERMVSIINDLNTHFEESVSRIDTGLAIALEFALFPERRDMVNTLLEYFQSELSDPVGGFLKAHEAHRFCQLASSLSVSTPSLHRLETLVQERVR